MVFLKYLLKLNIVIGKKLTYLIAKYEAQAEIEEVIKTGKFDMRNLSDRLKNVLIHDEGIVNRRLDMCKGCEFLFKPTNTCKKCGCFMDVKTKFATSSCPIGKWGKEYEFIKGQAVNGTHITS